MIRRLRAGRFGAAVRRRGAALVAIFFGTWRKQYNNSRESTSAMNELILILTTMPDDDRANQLARTLVEERLAACVNVHRPMTSTYRWHGEVESGAERQIVIKTTRASAGAVEARLRALHPYELPKFVIVNTDASAAYAAWVIDAAGGR